LGFSSNPEPVPRQFHLVTGSGDEPVVSIQILTIFSAAIPLSLLLEMVFPDLRYGLKDAV
jgi:hypothetical protein